MAQDPNIKQAWGVFNQWVLEEIMKFRARYIHVCYKVILPKAVYAAAAQSKDMKACRQWAEDNGWKFAQKGPSLLLLKDGKVLGEFRPLWEGGQMDPHLTFYAMIAGERIELVLPEDTDDTTLTGLPVGLN